MSTQAMRLLFLLLAATPAATAQEAARTRFSSRRQSGRARRPSTDRGCDGVKTRRATPERAGDDEAC